MAARHKSFDDWTAQDIRYTFGIKEQNTSPLLEEWLSKSFTPNMVATTIMDERRAELNRHFRSWNEDELKFQFISQIVMLAQLRGDDYSTFSQRILSAVFNDVVLQGKPEVMVAKGKDDPVVPYFFIHEYKPTRQKGDPLGQVLAAMMAAQTLNADGKPIFGCFVIGAVWQFLILEGNNYTISQTYNANQANDLNAIYSALCQVKVYIEVRTKT